MQEILNELFYGNIRPNEKQFIRDSEYGKALIIVSDCEEKLMTLLSGKELEVVRKADESTGGQQPHQWAGEICGGLPLGSEDRT